MSLYRARIIFRDTNQPDIMQDANCREDAALLLSILQEGIREPLEGVEVSGSRILLNGF